MYQSYILCFTKRSTGLIYMYFLIAFLQNISVHGGHKEMQ